jgi:uncharacterized protein YcgI (DUF1989 family)
MTAEQLELIPARRGVAMRVAKGDVVKIINTHGTQVVDTWAFHAEDIGEFMSMEHSRVHMGRLNPKIGDELVSNKRRPIVTLVEDTSGGVHDTLIAACDRYRYQILCGDDDHDNCTDNLTFAMKAIGVEVVKTPSPLNLFMNIPVAPDESLRFEAPVSTPGSYVCLRAEMDLILVFSACPQDVLPVNGVGCAPTDAHFVLLAKK